MEENSHLLNEPVELQIVLKEVFHRLKANIEGHIDDFEGNEWIVDKDGSNTKKISLAWRDYNFASEIKLFK